MATATRASRKTLLKCVLVVVFGAVAAELCIRDSESSVKVLPPDQPPAEHRQLAAEGNTVAKEIKAPTSSAGIPERYVAAARLFDIGFAGGVRIDEDLRLALEGALSALDDSPTEDELMKFGAALSQMYPYEDSQRMLSFVRQYSGYLAAVREQVESLGIPKNQAEAVAVFDSIHALQRRYFDSEARQAIFGPYDGYARITMQAAFIQADERLSPEQKVARLVELRSQLPENMRVEIPISDASASSDQS